MVCVRGQQLRDRRLTHPAPFPCHFHETARSEAARATVQNRPFAVIIARLDGLPEINGRESYAAGDAALQVLGDMFARAAGRVQGRAFRVSGCRAGLIIPGLDLEAAEALSATIREELSGGPAATSASPPGRRGRAPSRRSSAPGGPPRALRGR
ncbi:MAG TPA: diguanylate cyclase [Solirubrobacteraceae bacterium]|nr:diguanylate cyclase [Solirubrobacteraceae bacterium]